jgi:hypothetical protein
VRTTWPIDLHLSDAPSSSVCTSCVGGNAPVHCEDSGTLTTGMRRQCSHTKSLTGGVGKPMRLWKFFVGCCYCCSCCLFVALHKTTHPTHLHWRFLGVTPLELVVDGDGKKTARESDVADNIVAVVCSAVYSVVRRAFSFLALRLCFIWLFRQRASDMKLGLKPRYLQVL